MSVVSTEVSLNRGRRQLLLIAALFLAPVILSWVVWMYLNNAGTITTTNAGQLVQPARPLQPVELQDQDGKAWSMDEIKGRWAYVMFAPVSCDAHCEQQLYYTRQIRIGISKDMQRLKRVLVLGYIPDAAWLQKMQKEQQDLIILSADKQGWSAFAGQFEDGPATADGSRFYMVDPMGNLMMSYGEDVPPRGIADDLRKLLKVSQVG